LDKVKRYNPNAHLVPNAADIAHFAKAFSEETIVPEEMRHIKSPIIAFVGVVGSYWVDLEIIRYAASVHPEWSFVLIGPIASGADYLKAHKNIHLFGKRDYRDLPGYLKKVDVCILPFVMNDLIKHTNPIKLYEYLAAGKPVVSTPIPEVLTFSNVVRIAKNKEEFVKQIEQALGERAETSRQARIDVAAKNSWDMRINRISEEIKKALEAKGLT
jgi:glycosyltransferase involved in cell wall biosynthesis